LAQAAATIEARETEHGAEVRRLSEVRLVQYLRAVFLFRDCCFDHQMLVQADGKIEALLSTSLAQAASPAAATSAAAPVAAAQDSDGQSCSHRVFYRAHEMV
jgi:hypothetical protein